MTQKESKKVRGVYEHPAESGIWWIQYFHKGKRRRERVGRKSDAITLVGIRKTQIIRDEKLPELTRKKVLFGDLLDDVLELTKGYKSARDYMTKAEILRPLFGNLTADDITSSEFRKVITDRGVSNGTFNRYRAFISLCYKEGAFARKVTTNPAKDLRPKKEPKGRFRFLNREEEYPMVQKAMQDQFPHRVDEFIFSVFSGARLDEQFSLHETECDFKRRVIKFVDTKNGEDREVRMNSVTFEILRKRIPVDRRPQKKLVFGSKHSFCLKTVPKKDKPVEFENESPWWFAELVDALGIHDYTWHNNRHTFCSWHAIAGTPLPRIKEMAGHKSITTTMRYAHLSPDHQNSESERIVEPPASSKDVLEFPTAIKTANGGD